MFRRYFLLFLSPLISIFIVTVIFSCLRLFEIFLHRNYLLSSPSSVFFTLMNAFILDFLFFLLWNGAFFLFHILAEQHSFDNSTDKRKVLFYIFNIPLIVLFFIDMQTIAVSGQLMNSFVLSAFKSEIILNSWILMRDYWYFIPAFILVVFPVLKYCPIKIKLYKCVSEPRYKRMSFLCLILLLVNSFALLSYKTNRIETSFYPETLYNGMYSRVFFGVHEKKYFFDNKTVKNIMYTIKSPDIKRKQKSLSVVLIIIESFSPSYLNEKDTPFLYKLSQGGLSLKSHVTLSTATMFSVRSILTARAFYDLKKNLNSPLNTFQKQGWKTLFFWGDKEGTLHFNKKTLQEMGVEFSYMAEHYLEMTGRKEDVGFWGDIKEKPFMRFVGQTLKNSSSPLFAIILTNEPHYPYDCLEQKENYTPEEKTLDKKVFRKVLFKSGKPLYKKINNCLRYVDQSIETFFKEIRKASWFENALFVFTGDHPNLMDQRDISRTLIYPHFDKSYVPLIFWSPKEKLKTYPNNLISSHADILPSLLDYVGLPVKDEFLFMNNFIFRPHEKKRLAYFSSSLRTWFLWTDKHLLGYSSITKLSHLWKVDKISTTDLKHTMIHESPMQAAEKQLIENEILQNYYEQILKASIQYYHYGF